MLISEIVNFGLKREVHCEFPQKFFKTTEKHNLAVAGSFGENNKFLFIFVAFYWFEKKKVV